MFNKKYFLPYCGLLYFYWEIVTFTKMGKISDLKRV